MDLKDRLKWIYSSKDNSELCERYNQWAKDYDSELEEDYGWMAPQIVTGFVTKYVAKGEKWFYIPYVGEQESKVKQFLKGRTVGMCQAINRLLNFHTMRTSISVPFFSASSTSAMNSSPPSGSSAP